MTKEQLADQLTGREYPFSLTAAEKYTAKSSGLVVVYGASDDLVEFEGSINDERGAYEGTVVKIHRLDILPSHADCNCEYCGYPLIEKQCASIEAVWSEGGYSWTYKTDIPHATFEIVEGDDKYCRGMVIDVKDLPVLVPGHA